MVSAVDASTSIPISWDRGTALLRPCQWICTSMSAVQASSGAKRWFTLEEGRNRLGSATFGLEREADFVLQVVIPAQGLLLRPIRVHNGFVLDTVLSNWISFGLLHHFAATMRRTDARSICNRRAISAWVM